MNTLVEFEHVSVTMGGVRILDDVCAKVPRGSRTAIVGPNGAGKTTLILTLLGHLPSSGRIRFAKSGLRMGYVPQRFSFDRSIPLTVLEFLALGLQRRPLWLGVARTFRAKAEEFLAEVDGEHLLDKPFGGLSGGELQRVLLALALAQDPELLIMDEPAAGVDVQGEMLFCELLDSVCNERNLTQLMVSHDLATVMHHASHAICLNRSVIVQGPPREVLTRSTLLKVFGLHMGLVDANEVPQTLVPRPV